MRLIFPSRPREGLLRVLLVGSVLAHVVLFTKYGAVPAPVSAPKSTPRADIFAFQNTSDIDSGACAAPALAPAPVPVPKPAAAARPQTEVREHAGGWTLLADVYMANGTLFIVSDAPRADFPPLEHMISTGLAATNSPESVRERWPTAHEMDFITPAEAERRWGTLDDGRVRTVEGSTVSGGCDSSLCWCGDLFGLARL